MDNQRLLIWSFFGLLCWLTYQTWLQDYTPQIENNETVLNQLEESLNEEDITIFDGSEDILIDTPEYTPENLQTKSTSQTVTESVPIIRVVTDVLDIEISTQGGTIQSATMLNYPIAKDEPDSLVELLSVNSNNFGAIQTGLRVIDSSSEPNHKAIFLSGKDLYELDGKDSLVVPLSWKADEGVIVEKRFRFVRGSYTIDVEHEVINNSSSEWRGANYSQIQRISKEQERSMFDVDSYSFVGPISYDGEKSTKYDRNDLMDDGPFTFKTKKGWLGSIQHHFLSAVIPNKDTEQSYRLVVKNNRSVASTIGQVESVFPSARKVFSTTVFVGPKLQSQLEAIDENLKLTVDYGWLTILSQPLFWLLSAAYNFIGNWGLAIIFVTFLIKLVFYKLTESSGRSMAKLRNLQPRMKALQDRYKDDKQALSTAMMELYKREKVNPAAGCLPILIQMPFFLAFYWVLLESVEMRQAPFVFWLTDLSTKDPYFILPLIMGAAMFFQQKLNPAPADPIQAKVMQIMPIMFTAFFAFFPSGLVLYWVTNTLLSIAQQWKINKVVERESKESKR
tara:strand:- start:133 stop:1821 length:1689 start_codon:yes stop_codon:yes gene_type:complete